MTDFMQFCQKKNTEFSIGKIMLNSYTFFIKTGSSKMFFRVIAFLVGLIAVVTGMNNYDSEVASSPLPVILGGVVMLIAVFNLIPQFKRCSSCRRKIPQKATHCPFCKTDQP